MLDESRVTTNEPSELPTSQIPNDNADDQGDEPEPELNEPELNEPELNEPELNENNPDNEFRDGESELFGTALTRICSLNFLLQSANMFYLCKLVFSL